MVCGNRQEGFVDFGVDVYTCFCLKAFKFLLFIVLCKKILRFLSPCTEVVLIEYDKIPVRKMNPLIVSLDCSGISVDSQHIL